MTAVYGEVAEWFKATVLKTVGGDEPPVGSNPTLAAKIVNKGAQICLIVWTVILGVHLRGVAL